MSETTRNRSSGSTMGAPHCQSSMVAELLKLKPGAVRSFIGADYGTLRQHLESGSSTSGQPIVLMKKLEDIPKSSELINDVLVTMATTARNLWPVWFTDVHFNLGVSPADRFAAKTKINRLREIWGLSPTWSRRAVVKAMEGKLPLVAGFSRETQLHQLRLAISRTGLVLVIAVAFGLKAGPKLASLANSVLWLARNAKLSVGVLLDPALAEDPALDHILHNPVMCVQTKGSYSGDNAGIEIVVESGCEKSTVVWLSLGKGRTHALSPGEAKLAAALKKDVELSSLFDANQHVETMFRNRATVDLLWADGRVVVEIDGDDHRESQKFAADRRRDFELLISGYSVLRLVNQEVLTDTERAVAQIRQVVRYRKKHHPEWERLA